MLGAEQSVIGCLMLAPALLDKARTMLSPVSYTHLDVYKRQIERRTSHENNA